MSLRYSMLACCAAGLLGGCVAGTYNVVPPTHPDRFENSIVVNKKRVDVWAAAVPRLGKQFFVINNIDQSSGLINVSYSGDPESFVDGGVVTSTFKNARGERVYTFPASRKQVAYEVFRDGKLYAVDRGLSLEGRANLIVEDLPNEQTRVTATVRYILTRTVKFRDVLGNESAPFSETIAFNSGEKGVFTGGASGSANEYWPTGKLETELLAAFK